MPHIRVDAIRFVPASWDPYQARRADDGIAISVSQGAFESLLDAPEAYRHPWTWVKLPVDAAYWLYRIPGATGPNVPVVQEARP